MKIFEKIENKQKKKNKKRFHDVQTCKIGHIGHQKTCLKV